MQPMKTVARYASLVKFTHTIFAMPFALVGYVYAITSTGTPFSLWVLVKILLCMVFARNAAMGFNRWADRRIDAENPRTAGRDIPAGRISPRAALRFVAVNAAAFLLTAAFINRLTLILAPVALFIILGYSYTKRFTAWAHIVLGTALAIAPAGAYIAVTGTLTFMPVILAGLVITWVGGFDILYAMQDAQFDKDRKLHSVPSRFSARSATAISIGLHLVTVYAVVLLGMGYVCGLFYWIGAGLFIALLAMQHILYTPRRIERIGATFGLVNGLASVTYAAFTIADLLVRS